MKDDLVDTAIGHDRQIGVKTDPLSGRRTGTPAGAHPPQSDRGKGNSVWLEPGIDTGYTGSK